MAKTKFLQHDLCMKCHAHVLKAYQEHQGMNHVSHQEREVYSDTNAINYGCGCTIIECVYDDVNVGPFRHVYSLEKSDAIWQHGGEMLYINQVPWYMPWTWTDWTLHDCLLI